MADMNYNIKRNSLRRAYKDLQDKVLGFKEFLTYDGGWAGLDCLDDETRGLLEEYIEGVEDEMFIVGEDLCYNFGLLEENDLAE